MSIQPLNENIRLRYHKFIPKTLKMYQTLIALFTYVIFCHSKMLKFQCKFRIDNFFNDVETMSFRRTISDWDQYKGIRD